MCFAIPRAASVSRATESGQGAGTTFQRDGFAPHPRPLVGLICKDGHFSGRANRVPTLAGHSKLIEGHHAQSSLQGIAKRVGGSACFVARAVIRSGHDRVRPDAGGMASFTLKIDACPDDL